MRKRPDRLKKLVVKKVPRPWKIVDPPEVEEPSAPPSKEMMKSLLLDVQERTLQRKISSRPLLNRRARLRRLGLDLTDIYKTE